MSHARISIVILTRNGAGTLPALLDAIWSQRVAGAVEVIAVDSGSTDGTLELLRTRVTTLLQVDAGDFDHGATRNLAISRTTGDLVAQVVQDARPLSDTWLDALTRPFDDDPDLAGTFSRQVPREDASALTRHYLQRWTASAEVPWTSRLAGGRAQLDALTPQERLARCTFDNVASCVRRTVWSRHPFKPTPIAEDLEWARDVLCGGHTISFVPASVVMHSHDRPARYELARTRAVHARLYELFGLQTLPTRASLARAIASTLALHIACEWRSPDQWSRAAALAVAWPLGQYLGARDGRSGRARRLPPGTI